MASLKDISRKLEDYLKRANSSGAFGPGARVAFDPQSRRDVTEAGKSFVNRVVAPYGQLLASGAMTASSEGYRGLSSIEPLPNFMQRSFAQTAIKQAEGANYLRNKYGYQGYSGNGARETAIRGTGATVRAVLGAIGLANPANLITSALFSGGIAGVSSTLSGSEDVRGDVSRAVGYSPVYAGIGKVFNPIEEKIANTVVGSAPSAGASWGTRLVQNSKRGLTKGSVFGLANTLEDEALTPLLEGRKPTTQERLISFGTGLLAGFAPEVRKTWGDKKVSQFVKYETDRVVNKKPKYPQEPVWVGDMREANGLPRNGDYTEADLPKNVREGGYFSLGKDNSETLNITGADAIKQQQYMEYKNRLLAQGVPEDKIPPFGEKVEGAKASGYPTNVQEGKLAQNAQDEVMRRKTLLVASQIEGSRSWTDRLNEKLREFQSTQTKDVEIPRSIREGGGIDLTTGLRKDFSVKPSDFDDVPTYKRRTQPQVDTLSDAIKNQEVTEDQLINEVMEGRLNQDILQRANEKAQGIELLTKFNEAIENKDLERAQRIADNVFSAKPNDPISNYKNTVKETLGKYITQQPTQASKVNDSERGSIQLGSEKLNTILSRKQSQTPSSKSIAELDGVKSRIQYGDNTPKPTFKEKADKFYTNWVDRFHPIESLTTKIEKQLGESIPSEGNPKIAIKRLLGAGSVADLRYKQEIQPILDNLKDVDMQDADLYLWAKRVTSDLNPRDIDTSQAKEAQKVLQSLNTKYGDGVLDSKVSPIYDLGKKNLNKLKEAGFIDSKTEKQILKDNQHYVKFDRVMDTVDNYLGLPTAKAQQPTNPLQKIKGSERAIRSPIESTIAQTYKIESAIAKNRVAQSLIGLTEIDQNLKSVIKQVDKSGNNTISVWSNGKKSYYEVPKDIADSVKGLNEDTTSEIIKWASVPARFFRANTTGRNPAFFIPNVFRDQLDAAINSKYGYTPFVDYFRGFYHMMNYKYNGGDEVVEQWMKSGGDIFFENMGGRKDISDSLNDAKINKRVISRLGDWIGGKLDVASDFSEKPTRLGVFMKAKKATGDPFVAASESREATLDFARMGAKMKTANSLIPFLNANVQGFDKMIRTFADQPKASALRMIMYGGIPALVTSIYNNYYHPKEYREVPDFEKESNFLLMTGTKDKDGNPVYVKIPKGHVITLVASPVENFVTWLAGNNPQSFGQLALQLFSGSVPVIGEGNTGTEVVARTLGNLTPQAIKPLLEDQLNRSFFKTNPQGEPAEIVPFYLKSKPPSEQKFKTTPLVYQKVGDILNVSPLRVKNFTENTFGSGAKEIVNTSELAAGRANINQIPITRRFVGSYEGFDNQRPESEETNKTGFLQRLLKPNTEASASESLTTNPNDLEVLYKDAQNTIDAYKTNSAKIRTGLKENQTLEEAQAELVEAKNIVRQMEKEQPEVIYKIGLKTYKSGGGSNVEERADWAYKQLKKAKTSQELIGLYKDMLENEIMTKEVLERVREMGIPADKYISGGEIKTYYEKGTTGKKSKAKKITWSPKKTSLPKLSISKVPPIKIKQPKPIKIKVGKTRVEAIKPKAYRNDLANGSVRLV